MLTQEYEKKSGKDTRVIIELKSEMEHQHEVRDHIHVQFQFQERDNLLECQGDFHNLEFGQIQMCVLKLNLGFQKT